MQGYLIIDTARETDAIRGLIRQVIENCRCNLTGAQNQVKKHFYRNVNAKLDNRNVNAKLGFEYSTTKITVSR
jgi:hypothetical protein